MLKKKKSKSNERRQKNKIVKRNQMTVLRFKTGQTV